MNARKLAWIPLLLAGCGGTPDDETELSATQSELVFGTVTTARPEIGFISSGAGGCTATLIAPNAILTAAHCLNPTQASLVQVPFNPIFGFRDISGVSRTSPIDKVHSFNWDSFTPSTNGVPLTGDVAVAHLIVPVPATQAIPATIAAARPTTGAASTMFGLGCTDRIFQDPFGTKRFVTFTFGTPTTSLCPGDSGGPEVFGSPTGGGAIWGVSTGAVTFFDTFADVAVHGKQIEAVIRSWDGLDERDADRVGMDYFVQVAPTVAVCRKGCEDDGRCRAFSWRASDQLCWRKQGAADPTPAPGITSGLPTRFEVGVDRLGGDFAALAIGSADACAAACGRNSSCRAWTQLGGSCFLKNTIPPASTGTCAACTSGVVARGLEQDTDRFGADYASVPNNGTPQDCAAACARDARCASFTHVGFGCFLKDSVAPASSTNPGQFITSGVRRGMDPESERLGGDYSTFNTELRPSLCQAACASDAQCLAWSYRPMGTFGQCTLKNVIGARVASPTNTSGLKGTEMLPAR